MLKSFFIFLLLTPLSVIACSCISEAKTMKEEFELYEAIFTGTSLEVTKNSEGWSNSLYTTKIAVGKVWKGKTVSESVIIATNTEINSCGAPPPEIGNEFLIFAYQSESGVYLTGGCSTFIDLTKVKSDLENASSDEQAFWNNIYDEMWSALGEPEVVFSK